MLTDPQLKSKVDALCDCFWSGGIANPLTAIKSVSTAVETACLFYVKVVRAADVLPHLLEVPGGHGQRTSGWERCKFKMRELSRSKPSNACKAESKSFDTKIALDNWLKDFSTNDAKKGT